jgi:hypothetical protein
MVGLSRVPQRQLLNEARNDSHEVAAATEVTDVYPDSQEAWSSTRHPLLVSPTTPNGSCAHRREPARETVSHSELVARGFAVGAAQSWAAINRKTTLPYQSLDLYA